MSKEELAAARDLDRLFRNYGRHLGVDRGALTTHQELTTIKNQLESEKKEIQLPATQESIETCQLRLLGAAAGRKALPQAASWPGLLGTWFVGDHRLLDALRFNIDHSEVIALQIYTELLWMNGWKKSSRLWAQSRALKMSLS